MECKFTTEEKQVVTVAFAFTGDTTYAAMTKKKVTDKLSITWKYGETTAEHVVIVGLGDQSACTLEDVRKAAGTIARTLKEHEVQSIQFPIDKLTTTITDKAAVLRAVVEGFYLGSYRFDSFRSDKLTQFVEDVWIVGSDIADADEHIAESISRATSMGVARDLANLPANHLNPTTFVEKIITLFQETDAKVKVITGDAIDDNQLVGLRHVGSGSKHQPAMVEITYRPDPSKKHIALVGKGVTFDMGGMSLKVVRDLSESRFDMGGAAAVVGTMHYLATSKKDVNVTAYVMIAENLPDANAYLPSTVIEYPNGVSVEVANTDAEGRLILADGLLYSQKANPDEVINICTLTGSVGIALGTDMAGVWSTGDIAKDMQVIGAENGDLVWEMPLVYDYKRFLASDYADLHNIGAVHEGGATIAALFLHHFAPTDKPWAHIDMAATIQSRENSGYNIKGATGYGVRLLSDYILEK